MPESSIIIPVSNRWEQSRKCLRSIAANTDRDKVEVIVIDNASNDSTQDGCPFLGRQLFGAQFHYIRNKTSRSFSETANQGAELAKGEYIIFLHNDIAVQPGWYQPLIDDFSEFPDIAASGPLLVSPDETPLGRTIQHLGIFVTPFLEFGHLYEGIPASSPLAKKRRFFQAITAACMIIRKSLFMEEGGFDGRFVGGCEDVDLCVRLFNKGYRLTVNPNSTVACSGNGPWERRAYTEMDKRLLAEKVSGIVSPDWHSHLKNDGLTLNISNWLKFHVLLPSGMAAELDAQASSMTTEELRDALIRQPFWETGWLEMLRRSSDENERIYLCNTFLKFFPNPEALLSLANLSWVRENDHLRRMCAQCLAAFALPPKRYLEEARRLMKFCISHRMPDLGELLAAHIRSYGCFLETDYPRFARALWNLESTLGITHSPQNPAAYTIWSHGIDFPKRHRELAEFLRSFTENPDTFPAISLLMPVCNPKPEHLRETLDSVLTQVYPKWELHIAAGAATDGQVCAILEEYAERDARIQVIRREENGHMTAAANAVLELVNNPWTALMDAGDLLAPDAMAFAAKAIAENPDALLFYSDEDKTDGIGFFQPYFKNSRWDRDLLALQNFACHLAIYRTDRLRAFAGLKEGFQDAQDHELLLRYTAKGDASGFIHIPHVLYHWRVPQDSPASGGQAKTCATESSSREARAWSDEHEPGAVTENLPASGWTRIQAPVPSPRPSLSIVCLVPGPAFPVAAYHDIMCAAGATETIFVCRRKDFGEISRRIPGEKKESCVLIAAADGQPSIKGLLMGAGVAKGEILGFIDGNVIPKKESLWLDEIIACLYRPGVGAVGGRIVDPSGSLVHAGYLADAGGSLKPLFSGHNTGYPSWFGWTHMARTVDALDRRCLFTRATIFREYHGFDPSLGDWGVQDYCLRIGKTGLRSVWWPFAEFTMLNAILTESGIETFSQKWRLPPANKNLFALGPGWQLNAPTDSSIYDFSPDAYLRLYPELKRAQVEPLAHYLGRGIREGRKGRLSCIDYRGLTPERRAKWKNAPKTGVVVCTSLCGNYERLLPPAFLNDGWQYVCYSDMPREDWGIWDIRPIPYENTDPTRRSRWAKMNLPFIFPDAQWVFWMDSNIVIGKDMSIFLDGRADGPGLWMVRHPVRNCVYQEAMACIAARKDDESILKSQVAAYAEAGMPEQFGMWENGCFLVDPGSPKTKAVFSAWWEEYCRRSKRDQVSLPYVFFRQRYLPGTLFSEGMSARRCPALHFLTHEETAWIDVPDIVRRHQESV